MKKLSGHPFPFGPAAHGAQASLASALMILLMLTSSCAAIEPVPFKGPNGKEAYSMRCSGMGRTIEDCYQKAGEICPDGYTIINQESSLAGSAGQGSAYLVTKRGLAIECK